MAYLGLAAHGVDVAEGVGGRDLAEDIGIVDRRGDEIGGDHDGQVFAEAVDAGVIAGVVSHQQVGVIGLGQTGEKRCEPDRVDFGRSAAGLGEALQGRLL